MNNAPNLVDEPVVETGFDVTVKNCGGGKCCCVGGLQGGGMLD